MTIGESVSASPRVPSWVPGRLANITKSCCRLTFRQLAMRPCLAARDRDERGVSGMAVR